MNGQFQVAQAAGTGNSNSNAPVRIFKLTKPLGDQAVVVNLGYDQKVQVDFSPIANEKITLVHVGEKLIILFDNQSTVTVEPFFDSRHDALNNLTIEVAPGRDLSVSEFANSFPITTDQSVLPAAGNGNVQATGGHFEPSAVDPLPPIPTNVLAPPEILPNLQFTNPTALLLPPTTATPDATIVKSFTTTPAHSADANQVDQAGQVIHYSIVVTNTGNETLTNLVVTDSQGIALTGGSATLAVGASETLTGTHIVTQAEIDAGTPIVNTATLTDSQGVGGSSTVTTVVDQEPAVTLVKSFTTTPTIAGDPANTADHANQVINYTVVVTNNGNETLTGLTVTDSQGNILTGGSATLAVGASETLTGTHIVTQGEIDAGGPIVNTATVTDNQHVTSTSTVDTAVDQHADVAIVKTFATTPSLAGDAPNTVDENGQLITYTLTVTNNGNETLTGVTITDALTGHTFTDVNPLAVGATFVATDTFNATQAQIDAGTPIVNTATVTDNQHVTSTSTVDTAVDQHADVAIVKTFATTPSLAGDAPNTVDENGQLITYTLTVTNNGNETLTGVTITDALTGHTFTDVNPLAVGATFVATDTFNATQAQIDAGTPIVNTATVTDNQHVTSTSTVDTAVDQHADVAIVKTFATTPSLAGDAPNTVDENGQLITYTLTVTNNGNETLTGVTITDALTGHTFTDVNPLAVGATFVATDTFNATQAQIDAGTPIVNTATVTDNQHVTSTSTVSTAVDQHADVAIVKTFATTPSLAGDAPNTVDENGQLITYTLTVTNNGNETLTGVTITDALTGHTFTDVNPLAVGATFVATDTFNATQAQIDAGGPIVNTATVTDNQHVTSTSTVDTAVDQHADVAIVKTFATTPSLAGDAPNTVDENGQLITYTLTVTNNGNETLTGVTITDALTGHTFTDVNPLAVGATFVATDTFNATQAQIDAGTPIVNTATVTDNQHVTSTSTVSTAVDQHADVAIVKTFATTPSLAGDAPNTVDENGQLITYTLTVTNNGNETLTGVTITDALTGHTFTDVNPLAVGATFVATDTFNATQAQIDAGTPIVNTATVTDNQHVTSTSTVSTAVDQHADVAIVKTFATTPSLAGDAPNTVDENGQLITYTLTVTNNGNETLTGVTITDALTGHTFTDVNPLAVGATFVATDTFNATQAQIDAGTPIVNTATVTDNQHVTSTSTVSTAVDQHADVAIVKTFATTPSLAGDAPNTVDENGQLITYTLTVTNNGNETLTGVTITDALTGHTFTDVNPLAVGATFVATDTFNATQAQIDAGTPIVNTATVTDNQHVTSTSTVSTAVDQHADVAIVKTFATTPSLAGDAPNTVDENGQLITYTLTVTNNGNETLTGVTITDALTGHTFTDVNPLAVGATFVATDTFNATQAQIDAGTPIVNTATVTDNQHVTSTSTVSTAVDQHADVAIVKTFATTPSLAGDAPNTVDENGQLITYTLTVTNNGNETLTGVTITDALTGHTFTDVNPLAVGATFVATDTFNATQAQIDAGGPIVNTATVTDNQHVTSTSTVDTAVDQHADVAIVKTFATTPSLAGDAPNTVDENGQLITYTLTVTNNGNETLTGVTITDALTGHTFTDVNPLAVGATFVATDTFNATQAQIDAGTPIVNTATVTDNQHVTSTSTVSTAVDQHADVAIVKTFATTPSLAGDAPNTVDENGQLITYTLTVTNNGNETLTGVTITDALTGHTFTDVNPLAVGATFVATDTFNATQAQIDAGTPIVNTATVTDNQHVTSTSTVSTAVDQHADVAIVKTFATTPSLAGDAPNTVDENGQLITYTLTVTNNGNETLTGVTITDALTGHTFTDVNPLAVGATFVATDTFNATQAQIDAGTPIVNTATVTDNQHVTSTSTVSTAVDQHAPTSSGSVSLVVSEAALSTVLKPNDIQAGITTGTTPLATTETALSGAGNQITFTAETDNITGIVFASASGITVTGVAPGTTIFWDINGSGQLEGHIGSAGGPIGIILAITGDTTATADGGTATPTITATLTDALPMPTASPSVSATETISVTGIQVIATTDGIHDTSNPGAVSVTIQNDTPSIGAIQNVVMPNVINTEAHGTWQPNFDAHGPNLTSAIGIAIGTAPAGETFTVTDTHTTNGGHEIFQVAVTGTSNYTFFEYTTYTAATGTGEMLAFTDAAASADPFFTLSLNANGTYVFDLENNAFLATQTFSTSGATPNNNGEFVEVDPTGTGAFSSGTIPAPSSAFPLIIDGFTVADPNPADHRVFKDTNGFGVDQSNLQPGSTLEFHFLAQQSDVSLVAGKATVVETATVTLFDSSGTALAHETINLTPDANHQITINIDAADWVGTGANAFQNFSTVDIENTGTAKFNPLSLTFDEATVISGTTLSFAPTITDGDGDTATGGNLSVALTGANSGGGFTLAGTGGDVFVASAHADTITGTGTGNTVDYSNAPSAVTVNLGTDTVSGGGGFTTGDTLHDIQNAIGSDAGGNILTGLGAGGSLLIGEGSGNTLTGQGSSNILVGGTGSDTLNGSTGGHDIFALQGTGGSSLNDTINNFSVTDEIVVDVGSRDITFGNAQTIGTAATISASQFSTGNGAPSSVGAAGSFYFDNTGHNLFYSNGASEIELAHIATGVAVTASQVHVH